MLSVGSFAQQSCGGLARRSFLRAGLLAPGLALAGRSVGWQGDVAALGAPAGPAKSVLVFWLGGGPSHLDLCDPKPKAPAEYRGPFSSIATRTPGLIFSELLPELAQRSDRFAVQGPGRRPGRQQPLRRRCAGLRHRRGEEHGVRQGRRRSAPQELTCSTFPKSWPGRHPGRASAPLLSLFAHHSHRATARSLRPGASP